MFLIISPPINWSRDKGLCFLPRGRREGDSGHGWYTSARTRLPLRGCPTHSGILCYLSWKSFVAVCGVFSLSLSSDAPKERKPRGLEQISTERNNIIKDPWNYMY